VLNGKSIPGKASMGAKEVYKNITFSKHLPLVNKKTNSADNYCLFIVSLNKHKKNHKLEKKHHFFNLCTLSKQKQGSQFDLHRS